MTADLFDLSGKIALVTGGSRGLGLQMVRAFAEHGADVIIASRKLDACEEAAAEVRAMGRRALAVSAHVGRWDEIDKLIEAAYAEFVFSPVLWPDFAKSDLEAAVAEFGRRERRFGQTSEQLKPAAAAP